MGSSRSITVTLGVEQQGVDDRVEAGSYSSASAVIRAALPALDREEEARDKMMRAKIQAAIDDPTPSRDAGGVFERIEQLHSTRIRASGGEI